MKKNNEQLKIMVPIILVAVILTIGIVRYITGMQRAIWQQGNWKYLWNGWTVWLRVAECAISSRDYGSQQRKKKNMLWHLVLVF